MKKEYRIKLENIRSYYETGAHKPNLTTNEMIEILIDNELLNIDKFYNGEITNEESTKEKQIITPIVQKIENLNGDYMFEVEVINGEIHASLELQTGTTPYERDDNNRQKDMLKLELRRLREDIESSDIKQNKGYINGRYFVPNPKEHLLQHLNIIQILIEELLEEKNGQN